jgi:hypothetical protein
VHVQLIHGTFRSDDFSRSIALMPAVEAGQYIPMDMTLICPSIRNQPVTTT